MVGKVSSFITQGVYSVATPFHPFGGAVDIIVVKQHDGTFRSTPWYVRFGKFQGVLKGAEKVVRIEVNGVEANFHMHLDNSGEAYFVREVDPDKDDSEGFKDSVNLESGREDNDSDYSNRDSGSKENDFFRQDSIDFNNGDVEVRDERAALGMDRLERTESDSDHLFYEFQDEQSSLEGSVEFSEYGSSRYDNLDSVERALESQNSGSEVVLVSVDGHILTAPISSSERNAENVQLSTPQFHLGPGKGTEEYNRDEDTWTADYLSEFNASTCKVTTENMCEGNKDIMSSEAGLETSGSDGEHPFHVPETQESANQGKELPVESNTGNKSSSLSRHEVFKSCLDLRELSVQTTQDDRANTDSSVEILEGGDEQKKKSPPRSLMKDEPEEENLEISRDESELSSRHSESPSCVSLPEVQVEDAIHERNTFDMDHDGSDGVPVQFVSNNQESPKHVEVDPIVERMHSGEESPASDSCSKGDHVEDHTGASSEDKKSDLSTSKKRNLAITLH